MQKLTKYNLKNAKGKWIVRFNEQSGYSVIHLFNYASKCSKNNIEYCTAFGQGSSIVYQRDLDEFLDIWQCYIYENPSHDWEYVMGSDPVKRVLIFKEMIARCKGFRKPEKNVQNIIEEKQQLKQFLDFQKEIENQKMKILEDVKKNIRTGDLYQSGNDPKKFFLILNETKDHDNNVKLALLCFNKYSDFPEISVENQWDQFFVRDHLPILIERTGMNLFDKIKVYLKTNKGE